MLDNSTKMRSLTSSPVDSYRDSHDCNDVCDGSLLGWATTVVTQTTMFTNHNMMTTSLASRRVAEWKRRWLPQGKQKRSVRLQLTGLSLAVIVQCSFFVLPFVSPVACWSGVHHKAVPTDDHPGQSGFDYEVMTVEVPGGSGFNDEVATDEAKGQSGLDYKVMNAELLGGSDSNDEVTTDEAPGNSPLGQLLVRRTLSSIPVTTHLRRLGNSYRVTHKNGTFTIEITNRKSSNTTHNRYTNCPESTLKLHEWMAGSTETNSFVIDPTESGRTHCFLIINSWEEPKPHTWSETIFEPTRVTITHQLGKIVGIKLLPAEDNMVRSSCKEVNDFSRNMNRYNLDDLPEGCCPGLNIMSEAQKYHSSCDPTASAGGPPVTFNPNTGTTNSLSYAALAWGICLPVGILIIVVVVLWYFMNRRSCCAARLPKPNGEEEAIVLGNLQGQEVKLSVAVQEQDPMLGGSTSV
eukprot:GHVQ01011869.1.p1 GENE.GHVQ01011869.1~~GHVQ01011869.1.p1  ORF type:complete len:463 (+),score=32.23 GHVQ01011869.1:141-1529(+)